MKPELTSEIIRICTVNISEGRSLVPGFYLAANVIQGGEGVGGDEGARRIKATVVLYFSVTLFIQQQLIHMCVRTWYVYVYKHTEIIIHNTYFSETSEKSLTGQIETSQ